MVMTAVLSFFYVLVACLAALMTYIERRETGERGLVYTTLGFVACAVWPVTILTLLVAVTARPSTS